MNDSISPLFDLTGTVCVVTGAGRGIGRAVAELFARAGAKVAVTDIDAANARVVADGIVAAGGKAVSIATDVSSSATTVPSAHSPDTSSSTVEPRTGTPSSLTTAIGIATRSRPTAEPISTRAGASASSTWSDPSMPGSPSEQPSAANSNGPNMGIPQCRRAYKNQGTIVPASMRPSFGGDA